MPPTRSRDRADNAASPDRPRRRGSARANGSAPASPARPRQGETVTERRKLDEAPHLLTVAGERCVILLGLADHALPRASVDGRRVEADRRQTAGEVHLVKGTRMRGDIAQSREAAEGLTQQGPGFRAEVAAQDLRVLDDRIGAEVRQRLSDRGRVLPTVSRPVMAPSTEPIGFDLPVPRWSSMTTWNSSRARFTQPVGPPAMPGRGASTPGPPCRYTR